MSSYVNPAACLPQTLQIGAAAGTSRALQTVSPQAHNRIAVPVEGDHVAHTLPIDRVAVSRVLLNAESLIAAIMGLQSHEVTISVSAGRYNF
jgi:hypothetical protein